MTDDYSAIGALADPVRRGLYEFVVAQPEAIGRDAAARGAGVALHTARFHLDRLVEEGLLTVDQRRLSGRSGPGAGRPAKVYSRPAGEVSVSLPERSYDLLGSVLAAAVERSLRGEALPEALAGEARDRGRAVGTAYVGDGDVDELGRAEGALGEQGFEPAREGAEVSLRNCPFDVLAREHTELVCGLNLDFVGGVVEGLGCRSVDVRLDPAPDRCCVRVRGEVSQPA